MKRQAQPRRLLETLVLGVKEPSVKTQTSPGPAVGSSKKGSKPTLQGASWLTNRRCVSVHPRPTGGAPRNLWHAVGKGESKRGVSNSQLLRIAGRA